MYWTGTQHLLCPLCLPSSLFPPPSPSLPTFRLPSHLLPEEYGNLQKGDEIIEINGVPIRWQNQEEVRICSGYGVHGWVGACVGTREVGGVGACVCPRILPRECECNGLLLIADQQTDSAQQGVHHADH